MTVKIKTRQQIFNNAYKGLRSQGFKRAMNSCGCAYRVGEDAASKERCAIGWNISNKSYQSYIEGQTPQFSKEVRALAGIAEENGYWARELQIIHDDPEFGATSTMQERLERFASKYELTIPE